MPSFTYRKVVNGIKQEAFAMKSANLNRYGSHLKKIAKATSRDEQMDAIRRKKFRASLVDDPLCSSDDISRSIEAARTRKGG